MVSTTYRRDKPIVPLVSAAPPRRPLAWRASVATSRGSRPPYDRMTTASSAARGLPGPWWHVDALQRLTSTSCCSKPVAAMTLRASQNLLIAPGGPRCWRRLEQSRRRERGRDHGVGPFADMPVHHMTAEHPRAETQRENPVLDYHVLRGCLKSLGRREPTQHQTRHGEVHHGFTALRQPFIVFAQATRLVEPRQCAFDHPPTRQQYKALGPFGT